MALDPNGQGIYRRNRAPHGVSPVQGIELFRYCWICLLPTIVKEDSVSCQSIIDLFRHGWIHLQPTIENEDIVSRRSSIDLLGYG